MEGETKAMNEIGGRKLDRLELFLVYWMREDNQVSGGDLRVDSKLVPSPCSEYSSQRLFRVLNFFVPEG